MDGDISDHAIDEDNLDFEIADDALERAANPGNGGAMSYVHCTFPWYYCDVPQEPPDKADIATR
jgi:hypothetical protein